jgi:phage terminase large subunit
VITIPLPFTPRPWQRPLLADAAPRIVAVVHRRAGKSSALMWRGLRKAATWRRPHLPEAQRRLDTDPPRVVHVLPQRVQWARTGLWDRLEAAARGFPGAEVAKSEMAVRLPGGGVYQCGGMDNPESWRGGYADELIEDEADDVLAGGLDMVVEPMLADYLGTRLWSGTPKGNGRLQARWDEAVREAGMSRYLLRWQDTGALSDDAVAALRQRLTAEEFAQEMECSFEAPNSGAFYARLLDQAERDGRITRVPHDPRLPVETWWDLGMDDATAIWFVQMLPGAGEVRVIDYAEASGEALAHYAQLLAARGYTYSTHRLPHDAQVRELGTGRSRVEMLTALGVRPVRVGRALPVVDGINAAKMLMPRCWWDGEKTARGRAMLRRYRREWLEERGVWSAKPVHDETSHAADAFREGAVSYREPRDPAAAPPPARAEGVDYDPLGRR